MRGLRAVGQKVLDPVANGLEKSQVLEFSDQPAQNDMKSILTYLPWSVK